MTLIFCVRDGISIPPSPCGGLNILAGKRDLNDHLGSFALRNESERSAQHRRSFSHALNPEAVRRDSHGLGVKATSVIDYRHFNSSAQPGKTNADSSGSSMSGNISQRFLENAIQSGLDSWRQVA
jgi:hypothetical protein